MTNRPTPTDEVADAMLPWHVSVDFILNYDIKYRLGRDGDDGEEQEK